MKGAESSWGLSAAASRYISDKIYSLLQPYLENIIIDAQVGLKPEVTLTDIMLREDALDHFALPLRVSKQSRVSLLKISLPLTSFNTDPVTVDLQKVRVFVVPNERPWQGTAKNQEKLQRLAAWREQQRSRPSEGESKSFLSSLQETVLNNLKVTVGDLEVVYLDEVSLGFPCFVRLYVSHLELNTTNNQWTSTFSQSKTETLRKLEVKELSLAVVVDKPEHLSEDLHDYFHRVALSERHYILSPCNLVFKHRLYHTERRQIVMAEVSPLEFSISEAQVLLLQHCLRYFAFKRSYAHYNMLRPSLALKTDPRAWWRYLVRIYQLDLGRGKRPQDSQRQHADYLELFKRHQDIIHAPWLKPLKLSELDSLRNLEDALPLRVLLNLRSTALAALRQEAAAYVQHASAEGSNIAELWTYYMKDFEESAAEQPTKQTSRCGDTFPSQQPNWIVKITVTSALLFLQRSSSRELRQPILHIFSREECNCESCQQQTTDFIPKPLHSPSDQEGLEYSEEEAPNEHMRKERRLLPAQRNIREYSTSFDNVKAILKVTSERPDSKLFTEGTLLIVHLDRINADVEGFGTQLNVKGKLGALMCWDMQSLNDYELQAQFLAGYGLSSLLREGVEWSMKQPRLFHALRHFLALHGMLGCFEFFVHYLEISNTVSTTPRYCTCKHMYTADRLYEAAFKEHQSDCFLQMGALQQPEDTSGLQEVADRIETVFKEDLLPRFLRNCARWVMPSLLLIAAEPVSKKNQHLRDSKPAGELKHIADFSLDLAEATSLQLALDWPRFTITNTTVSALLQWLQLDFDYKPFSKTPLQGSFVEMLRELSPSVTKLMAICQQVIQPEERTSPLPALNLEIDIKNVEIQLLDHCHMQKYREVPIVLMQLQRFGVHITAPVPVRGQTRACYLKTEVEVEGIQVQSLGCALLRTSLQLVSEECLIHHTLDLPDRVLDIHIPELQVEVNSTLLPVLTFLQGVQTSHPASPPVSSPAKRNFSSVRDWMMGKHFPGLAFYWQLKHLKYLTAVYFTLGAIARPGGLLVLFNSAAFAAPMLSLHVPLVIATFQEKVFTVEGSVLLSEVKLEPAEGESVSVETSQGLVFPRVPAELFPMLPLFVGALEGEDNVHLQEMCVFKLNKLPKLPIETLSGDPYKERASLSLEDNKTLRRSLRSSNFEPRSVGLNRLKLKLDALRWHMERPILQSRLLAALVGVGVILDTAERLKELQKESSPQLKYSKSAMEVLVSVKRVEVQSTHPSSGLVLTLQEFTLKTRPESSPTLLNSLSFDLAGLTLELLSEGEGLNSVQASVLSVSGEVEWPAGQRKQEGRVRVGSVKFTCGDNVSLMAIPSNIHQGMVVAPIGKSALITFELAEKCKNVLFRIGPVAVLLEAKLLMELKLFFQRQALNRRPAPVTPRTLLSGPDVFVHRDTIPAQLNVDIERIQVLFCAKQKHFLRLTLDDITLKNSGECFPGSIRTVKLEPPFQEYSSLLQGSEPMVAFEVVLAAKLLRLRGCDLQYYFINRSLEDLLGFIKCLKSPKKLGDPPPTKDFTVDLICEKATIIVPSNSEGQDQVIIEVAHVELNNALRLLSRQVPKPLQPGFEVVKRKEVTVGLSEEVREFLCDVISVQGGGSACMLRKQGEVRRLCTVTRASVEVYSAPSLPLGVLDQWNLDVQVGVALEGAHLTASLTDLKQLSRILESNIDEKSELWPKTFKWEKTDFRFQWGRGGMGLAKWALQPTGFKANPIAPVQALDEREEES